MRTLRSTSQLALLVCGLSLFAACKEGDVGDFDASFGDDEDGGNQGAKDSGKDDEDGGTPSDVDAATGSDAGSSDVLKPEAVPAALAKALCDGYLACRGEILLTEFLHGEDCATVQTHRNQDGELRFLPASIEQGRVVFDGSKFPACASAYAELGCDARVTRLPEACEATFAGTVALKGKCDLDLDCKGAAFCAKDGDTCPGTCTALRAAGDDCGGSRECDDGLLCANGTCQAPGAEGADCTAGHATCGLGQVCNVEGNAAFCRDIATIYAAGAGADCDPSNLCAPELVCASMTASGGTCVKPVAKDAACHRALPAQCPAGQYCDAVNAGEEGACVDMPKTSEPCLTKEVRGAFCAPGFTCVSNVCQPINAAGGSCSGDAECYSGTCLDNLCVTPVQCTDL